MNDGARKCFQKVSLDHFGEKIVPENSRTLWAICERRATKKLPEFLITQWPVG